MEDVNKGGSSQIPHTTRQSGDVTGTARGIQPASRLPPQLIDWLYKVIQPQYIHKQVAYSHVIQAFEVYFPKGFRIRTRVYTSDRTGRSNLLINIFGTLDDVVPIEIWLPTGYPFSVQDQDDISNGVPIIYVVPDNSRGLFLKPGNHVDGQGKVYHPFLTEWFSNCKTSDPTAIKTYNLINLLYTIGRVFRTETPVYHAGVRSPNNSSFVAPQNPPNRAKSNMDALPLGATHTGSSSVTYDDHPRARDVSSTGPSLPAKLPRASVETIPSRYQRPLPLPSERLQQTPPLQAPANEVSTPPQSTGSAKFSYPKSPSPPSYVPDGGSPNSKSHASWSQRQNTVPSLSSYLEQDLMDRDDRTQISSRESGGTVREVDKAISRLSFDSSDTLKQINLNSVKIAKLHDQLVFHNTQATANKVNLESHRKYLSAQLNSILTLNGDLQEISDSNSSNPDTLYLGSGKEIDLDALVIPDSALTKQLYETVAEIKANKDCLGLINGDLSDTKEAINDYNLESVVKAARNFGRETFWLELTRIEIQRRMSLQDFRS